MSKKFYVLSERMQGRHSFGILEGREGEMIYEF